MLIRLITTSALTSALALTISSPGICPDGAGMVARHDRCQQRNGQ